MINQSSVTYSGQLESAGANPIQKGRQTAFSIFKNLLAFGLFAFLLLGVQGTLAAQDAYDFEDIWPKRKKELDKQYPKTVVLWDWYGRDDYPIAYIEIKSDKEEISNLNNLKPAMGGKAHGMYVPKGYYVELYQQLGYQGNKYVFTEGLYVNLWWAKDMAYSMKIIRSPNYDPTKGLEECAYFYGSNNKESEFQSYEGLRYGEYSSTKQLSAAASYNYLFVKGDMRIFVWTGNDFSGKNNFDSGTVFYDKNEGAGTLWNLKDYGFGKNIRSVKVLESRWALESTKIEEIESMNRGTNGDKKRQPIGAGATFSGDAASTNAIDVEVKYVESVEINTASELTTGLTISTSFEVEKKILQTGVTITAGIEAMIQSTLTTGKTTSETVEKTVSSNATVDRNPNCNIIAQVTAIPRKKHYLITRTYIKADTIIENQIVPILFNGKPKKEVVKTAITINDFVDFNVSTNYEPGNPNCPHVAPVTQSGGPSTDNTTTVDVATVKEVLFHSQASLSLAEAQAIAQKNGWKIASSSEVEAAFTYRNLDVYAFGRMADGRFAVPVQSNHSNFQKGPNIDAVGGNQGFFYTGPGATVATSQEISQNDNESAETSVTVVECSDGNGELVGYFKFKKDTGKWVETDAVGKTKFTYELTWKEDQAIHLRDVSRSVDICLELDLEEVLYSDSNNTTPFSIYTISDAY